MRTMATPPGTAPRLSPALRQALHQRVAQPDGCASAQALGPWLQHAYGRSMAYNTGHTLVRYRRHGQLKVPRKAPIHTP
jgi:hypothetical protein